VAMWQLHLHRYQGLPPAKVFDGHGVPTQS